MKTKWWLPLLMLNAAAAHAGEKKTVPETSVIRLIETVHARTQKLACVTPRPFYVTSLVSFLGCRGPTPAETAELTPHQDRYIKVYITPESKQTLLEGKGVYPPGTLIVKEKCRDAAGQDTELFTAMLKHEAGYNPACGDWEFLVLDRDTRITAAGKIESCMECHQKFQHTDYVARVYLQGATAGR